MKSFFKPGLPLLLLLAACEAAVTPNAYQDYTPPRVVAMYPAADTLYAYTNTAFYVQFDDRMDPAIAAYDSDALVLENISVIPPERVPLTFQLVNADTCLIADFAPELINTEHVYRIQMSESMKNFSRMSLQDRCTQERYFFFKGSLVKQTPAFALTSHANNDWGGLTITLGGTCTGIETITVFFNNYSQETARTFRLPYGATTWSVSYSVNPTIIPESKQQLNLIAAPYASPERIPRAVTLNLDLQPPLFMVDWPYEPGLIVTNNAKIKGIAVDNTSITNISIQIGTNNWLPAMGTLDWYRYLNTTSYSNGNTTLNVKILDQAGNCSHISMPVFISNH